MAEKDSWRRPIDVVREEVEKWDSTGALPKPVYDAEGHETLSSVLRRTVAAAAMEKRVSDPGKNKWREQSGVFRSPTGLTDETPAMREYLIECRRELARREGKPYLGPVAEDHKRELWEKDVEKYNAEQDARIHEQTPNALRRFGLEDQEINLIPELEKHWNAVHAVAMFMYPPLIHSPSAEKKFLVLGGAPGTGKTLAAASALLTCVEELRSEGSPGVVRISKRWAPRGAFFRAAELSKMQHFGKDAEKAWERLFLVRLLIVDDLGTEAMNDWWRDAFSNLVIQRARTETKTIFTTNLPGSALKERYSDRVVRRLTDYGTLVKCEKPGPSIVEGP